MISSCMMRWAEGDASPLRNLRLVQRRLVPVLTRPQCQATFIRVCLVSVEVCCSVGVWFVQRQAKGGSEEARQIRLADDGRVDPEVSCLIS